jgi:hypothetical protein
MPSGNMGPGALRVPDTTIGRSGAGHSDRTQRDRGEWACRVELGTPAEWPPNGAGVLTWRNAGGRGDGIVRLVTGLDPAEPRRRAGLTLGRYNTAPPSRQPGLRQLRM